MNDPNDPNLFVVDDSLLDTLLGDDAPIQAKRPSAPVEARKPPAPVAPQPAPLTPAPAQNLVKREAPVKPVARASWAPPVIETPAARIPPRQPATPPAPAPAPPPSSFDIGIAAARAGRWNEAAESLEKSVAAEPRRAEAWQVLGVCRLRKGRSQDALAAFERSTQINGSSYLSQFGRAVALHTCGRHYEALGVYLKLLAARPDSGTLLANALGAAIAAGEFARARGLAERLLRVEPQSRIALAGLAAVSVEAKEAKEAVAYAGRLAAASPESYEDWHNLGVCYYRQGLIRQAAEAFQEALKRQSDNLETRRGLAATLTSADDWDAARQAWETVLALAPDDTDALAQLGHLAEKAGDKLRAEKNFKDIVTRVPDHRDAWFRYGVLLLDRGDAAGAAEAFDRCLELKPDWADAAFNRALAKWRLGDRAAATAAFEQALDLDPGSLDAAKALAALAIDSQNEERARTYYGCLRGSAWEISYNLGLLSQKQGSLNDAATLYREALDAKPNCVEALINLGHVLISQGSEAEAADCWRRAKEISSDGNRARTA